MPCCSQTGQRSESCNSAGLSMVGRLRDREIDGRGSGTQQLGYFLQSGGLGQLNRVQAPVIRPAPKEGAQRRRNAGLRSKERVVGQCLVLAAGLLALCQTRNIVGTVQAAPRVDRIWHHFELPTAYVGIHGLWLDAQSLPWDPEKSFEPIVYTHVVPLVFAINPQIPAKNLPEFLAWMKANPDKAKVATSGRGSAQEMAAEMFRMATHVDMLLIPYKGSSAAHPDLLASRTALYIDTISAIQSQVKAGNARAIAVSTSRRAAALPDVPSADEQELKGYDSNTNGGFLAPQELRRPSFKS